MSEYNNKSFTQMKNPFFRFSQSGLNAWMLEKRLIVDWRSLESFERSLDQGWNDRREEFSPWKIFLFSFTISLVYCGSSLFFSMDISLISGFFLQISDPLFCSSLFLLFFSSHLISRLIRYLICNFFHHLEHFVALEARKNNLGR